jgi:hypothetical protein
MEETEMTEEDKILVCNYMKDAGWFIRSMPHDGEGDLLILRDNMNSKTEDGYNCFTVNFDLNDAALCVAEMQKRGDWEQFHNFVIEWGDLLSKASFAYITSWLMSMEEGQAKNFFKDFCEWRKGK